MRRSDRSSARAVLGAGIASGIWFCLLTPPVAAKSDRDVPDKEPSAGCGNFDYRYERMAAGPVDYRGATGLLDTPCRERALHPAG